MSLSVARRKTNLSHGAIFNYATLYEVGSALRLSNTMDGFHGRDSNGSPSEATATTKKDE